MASLQELATGRTSVFVAHRLSTVQGCDRIYVLKDGLVAEEGTHAELMAKSGGLYREMWKMQAAQQALDKKAGKTIGNGEEDQHLEGGSGEGEHDNHHVVTGKSNITSSSASNGHSKEQSGQGAKNNNNNVGDKTAPVVGSAIVDDGSSSDEAEELNAETAAIERSL